ncbi:MAG: hypothetical protein AAF938_22130 [Myxococcota bacterium]
MSIEPNTAWTLLGLALLSLALGTWLWLVRVRHMRTQIRQARAQRRARIDAAPAVGGVPCPPQRYDEAPAAGTWTHDVFVPQAPEASVHPSSWELADQPTLWRSSMAALGKRLRNAGVADITTVHGTFVGNDPLALLRSLNKVPGLPDLERHLGPLVRGATGLLLNDASNFAPAYPSLLQSATGVPSYGFHWSSENGHVARLRAAIRLAVALAARLEHRSPERRTLLVGHSHAGQVFALLFQLRDDVAHAPLLLAVAERIGADASALRDALDVIRRHPLDCVTLGTPVRYGWPEPCRERLLHIINHRGDEPMAGRFQGVLSTEGGDYIQQFGIAGSDMPSADPDQRALEAELDDALGVGWAPRTWVDNVMHRRRVPDAGFTFLTDFQDQASGTLPNLHTSGLGHAVYTRRNAMAYWLTKAVGRFYT